MTINKQGDTIHNKTNLNWWACRCKGNKMRYFDEDICAACGTVREEGKEVSDIIIQRFLYQSIGLSRRYI